MIERYTLPDMGRIWSDEEQACPSGSSSKSWRCEALAELWRDPARGGRAHQEATRASTRPSVHEIEEATHHDVIAFLTNIAEHIGNDSRYVHLGLTSSRLARIPRSRVQIKECGRAVAASASPTCAR